LPAFSFYKSFKIKTNNLKSYSMKKLIPAGALILLTASIVFAATKVEYHDNETCHSEWNIYQKGSATVTLAKADSQVIYTGHREDSGEQGKY
jgi:hypothetical protein